MTIKEKTLFLTYDGLLDPLGQSQILPYLEILSEEYFISVISFEKKNKLKEMDKLNNKLLNLNINHKFLIFTKGFGKMGRFYDIIKFFIYSFYFSLKYKFKIIHCRGHPPAYVAYFLKNFLDFKLIFDFRGLWIDERIDNHSFDVKSYRNKFIYFLLKKIEKKCILISDHTVVLTNRVVDEIKKISNNDNLNITVIPTCADYDFYNFNNFKFKKNYLKSELNISLDKKIICYCGSLGGVYLFNEMIDFFTRLKKKNDKYIFLIMTNTLEIAIKEIKKIKDINIKNSIIIKTVNREKIPLYLSIVDIMIVFINDTYARQASSPTKIAEAFAMGIPIVSNRNVGDIDNILKKYNAGISVDIRDEKNLEEAVLNVSSYKKIDGNELRNRTRKVFGLEFAKKKYLNIYKSLINL